MHDMAHMKDEHDLVYLIPKAIDQWLQWYKSFELLEDTLDGNWPRLNSVAHVIYNSWLSQECQNTKGITNYLHITIHQNSI